MIRLCYAQNTYQVNQQLSTPDTFPDRGFSRHCEFVSGRRIKRDVEEAGGRRSLVKLYSLMLHVIICKVRDHVVGLRKARWSAFENEDRFRPLPKSESGVHGSWQTKSHFRQFTVTSTSLRYNINRFAGKLDAITLTHEEAACEQYLGEKTA